MIASVAGPQALDWSLRQVAIPSGLENLRLPGPGARVERLGGETMGTTWSVSFVDEGRVDHRAVRRRIDACLGRVIAEMSTWEPSSNISRFNRSAGEWHELPDGFARVLATALDVARESGGAYDPTTGPLVDVWGFGPQGSRSTPPANSQVAAALQQCGWERIDFDAEARRARQPGGMRLDLSSIAKGFAVDEVAARLRADGIDSSLVEIGGELRGIGMKPGAEPWWVSVESPIPTRTGSALDEASFDLLIALHGFSVATSGDYRKGFSSGGRWFSHTIDPRTGRPVNAALASVTVLHPECMTADAMSTALTVLGLSEGIAFAAARQLAALFIERTAHGMRPHATPALEALLR